MKPTRPPLRKTAHRKAQEDTGSRKKHLILMGAGVLLLFLLATWYLRANSQVAKVLQMRKELISERDQLAPEERQQKVEELRAEREKLSPEERELLRKEMAAQFQKKINADGAKYLAMSPQEREKVIDERIARAEAPRPTQVAPLMQTAGAGAGGGGGGQGNPNSPRTPATPEDRDTKRRESLLNLTPEARAGLDQMRQDLAQRRAELGLSPSTGRGGKGR
jgi:hypothetical protein